MCSCTRLSIGQNNLFLVAFNSSSFKVRELPHALQVGGGGGGGVGNNSCSSHFFPPPPPPPPYPSYPPVATGCVEKKREVISKLEAKIEAGIERYVSPHCLVHMCYPISFPKSVPSQNFFLLPNFIPKLVASNLIPMLLLTTFRAASLHSCCIKGKSCRVETGNEAKLQPAWFPIPFPCPMQLHLSCCDYITVQVFNNRHCLLSPEQ